MKHISAYKWILLFFAISISSFARAGHASLFEMSYRHVTGNTYEFTVTYYRYCLGASAPAPVSLQLRAKSASLSVNNLSAAVLTKVAASGQQPLNLLGCLATPFCYEEYIYRGQVNLNVVNPSNPLADDWIFYYQECCYPPIINNVSAGDVYGECGLNNLDFPAGNNSPVWHDQFPNWSLADTTINYPMVSVCENRFFTLDESAVEYDGDPVIYELVNAMSTNGTSAAYIGGFSPSNPLPLVTPPAFKIDSFTGQIELTPAVAPSNPGQYIVAIKATDYAMIGGVLTKRGHVIRHLTVIVETFANCIGNNIAITTTNKSLYCKDTSVTIDVNSKYRCASADINGSFIEFKNVTTSASVPIKKVSPVSCWNEAISQKFEVVFNNPPLAAGTYYMTFKTGGDGNTIISECGIELPATRDTVWLVVDSIDVPGVIGSPDTMGGRLNYIIADCGQPTLEIVFDEEVLCSSVDPSGADFQLIDSNGAVPAVNPAIVSANPGTCTGGSTKLIILNLASGLTPGNYGLLVKKGTDGNTVQNPCEKEAPVSTTGFRVNVKDVSVDLGPDLWYCRDSAFQALLEAPAGYTYQWSTGDVVRQIIVNTKGTYIVTIENSFGCQDTDTLVVTEVICGTGIGEAKDISVELYPNPTSGKLYVKNTGIDRTLDIQVSDIHGKEVYRSAKTIASQSTLEIDLSGQAKGIYFVKISEANELLQVKRIILE